jgi:hypothetical protein
MPNDLSQPIAIVDAKAAKQELEAAVLALVQAYESQYGCLVAGLLARRQAGCGIGRAAPTRHLDGVPVSAVPSPVMPQPLVPPHDNDGARMADDYFCQGCGARGVFGFCAECR